MVTLSKLVGIEYLAFEIDGRHFLAARGTHPHARCSSSLVEATEFMPNPLNASQSIRGFHFYTEVEEMDGELAAVPERFVIATRFTNENRSGSVAVVDSYGAHLIPIETVP